MLQVLLFSFNALDDLIWKILVAFEVEDDNFTVLSGKWYLGLELLLAR